jgi:hypothetical protein
MGSAKIPRGSIMVVPLKKAYQHAKIADER